MKLRTAVIAAAAAVVIAVAGGAGVAALTRNAPADGAGPPTSGPSSSAGSPTVAPSTTPPPSSMPPPSATPPPASATDPLSEENLLRERAYHDVTGHDFTLAARASTRLGPCTGDVTFADALPRRVSTRSVQLDGTGGRVVVEHLGQTASAQEARTAATEIIAGVDECAAIQGGDFGYGDAVTVSSSASGMVVYFPAYDSDRDDQGGYIVIQAGARVGVVDANDAITRSQLVNLAKVAAEIAAV